MAGADAFDNPLIPNARLREMYLAMLRARRLEESLPPRQRAWTIGLEACLVAPAIALKPDDVISDAVGGATVKFLRGSSLESVAQPENRRRKSATYAGAGVARAIPAPVETIERLWSALGAAATLRHSAQPHSTSNGASNASGSPETPAAPETPASPEASEAPAESAVAVVYLRPGDAAVATQRRIFSFAVENLLPVLFVILPPSSDGRTGKAADAARRSGMPVMAVDRDDAVALYRVAQESIGRARMGGGPAAIECVRFVVKGQEKEAENSDPLKNIERYVLERSIVNSAWIAREARTLASRLPGPVH